MGHVRLGRLPTSRNWREVVALLEQNAPVDAVAAGASGAAETLMRQLRIPDSPEPAGYLRRSPLPHARLTLRKA